MNRFFKYTSLVVLLIVCTAFNGPIGKFNPNEKSPFKVSEKHPYYNLIKDYRSKFTRLSGLEFSGLHWNMGVVTYINKNAHIYQNNHIHHLQVLNYEEYEEEGDDFEEDEFEEDEFEDEVSIVKPKKYPVGTVFIKENYVMSKNSPVAPSFLTIMIKRKEGFDQKYQDWEYVQINADGEELLKGASSNKAVYTSCTECHSNIGNRDYVFSTFLTKAVNPKELIKK